jgi:peptidoglycan/LPS O-acetylase OafA/YrhL
MGLNHIFCVKNLIHSITTIRISNLLTDHAKKHAFYYTDGLIGLRGFAAFWVLIYHVWVTSTPRRLSIEIGSGSINFPPFFSCGWAGVDIFYTLFGFHLTLPFARAAIENIENPGLWHYFRRRILRIFPAYYAQLGILLCLAWMRRIFHRSADLWHRCKLTFWEIPIWKQIHHIFGCCQL